MNRFKKVNRERYYAKYLKQGIFPFGLKSDVLENLGFEILEEVDLKGLIALGDYHWRVKMPDGWRILESDNVRGVEIPGEISCYNYFYVIDKQERARIKIEVRKELFPLPFIRKHCLLKLYKKIQRYEIVHIAFVIPRYNWISSLIEERDFCDILDMNKKYYHEPNIVHKIDLSECCDRSEKVDLIIKYMDEHYPDRRNPLIGW